MIDQFYIDSAIIIRKEYVSLTSSLDIYRDELKEIADIFLETAKDLEKYNKTILKEKSVEVVKSFIVDKLDHLEIESGKLAMKINPINDKIEKLKAEEVTLYNTLVSKYPELSPSEIRSEIQDRIADK